MIGVSSLTLAFTSASSVYAEPLKPSYSPRVDNGGGTEPVRTGVINVFQRTDTINGDYRLRGTSARRFTIVLDTVAERQRRGEVVSGYDAIVGRRALVLAPEQKTQAVSYPDLVQGTRQSTVVYDNDRLAEIASDSARVATFADTDAPVYGDLRLANISQSNVTIATGDKGRSLYDPSNFALLTADTGSTLYNVTGNSTIVYDSVTATMHGTDQDGLSQAPMTTVQALVTDYSGVAFGAGERVNDLASLKRYNTNLIAELTNGRITPAQYDARIQAAVTTVSRPVTVRTPEIPTYTAPPTTSDRLFMALNTSTLTTTAGSQLVGVIVADGNEDGLSTLILARNGSSVVNNGTIVQGGSGPGIRVTDAGSSLLNTATGVIGVGYETLDRSGGIPVPTGFTDYEGGSFGNIAVRATDGAVINNLGIINVSNRDISAHPEEPRFGKANNGIIVSSGAQATNGGTILIGGGDSEIANTPGLFGGATGLGVFNGGTATNATGSVIRVGSSFAGNLADLGSITDVRSTNHAAGMASIDGGGAIINDGLISIGALTQNASGMRVGGDGNTALNNGTITIETTRLTTSSARSFGIAVLGGNGGDVINAVNATGGSINVNGVNSVGLLVENTVVGGSARAVNDGLIAVNGSLSAERLRNYGIFVGNAASSVVNNGHVLMRGAGAIGIHARNGGVVAVSGGGGVDFQNVDQIGYYALGVGSSIAGTGRTDVDTERSTGLRIEGGARAVGTGMVLTVSGASALGVVASGASAQSTFRSANAAIAVTGAGAVGVRIEGGASGLIEASTRLSLAGANTIAGVVDGQAFGLDGIAAGAPVTTSSLVSNAAVTSDADNSTGYLAQNGGQFRHNGALFFTGAGATGIRVVGAGSTATHAGQIALGGGTGVAVLGARFVNNGSIVVADGTGILLDGAGSILAGTGSSAVQASTGIAALRVTNGATLDTSGSFAAGGTAHAILADTGAGAITLGNGTLTTTGTGNGIENMADSSAIRLNGGVIRVEGSGSGVRSAVALDPASTAIITAAGSNSIGFHFAGTDGAATTGDLTLGEEYAITASGVAATGVRLATTGSATLAASVSVTNTQGGSALVAGPAAHVMNVGALRSLAEAPVVDLRNGNIAFITSGTVAAGSPVGIAIAGGNNGQSVTVSGGAVTGVVSLGSGADRFTMTGGTLTGALKTGAGDDTATFRDLTDANLAGTTGIAGSGVIGGRDVLAFQNSTTTGTTRLTGWNAIDLTASTLVSNGDLTLAGGTFAIDRASTFHAGAGSNTVVGASSGGIATVVNAGRIDLTNGSTGATDTLVIRGDYVGQGGVLALQTVLGSDNSLSDRLVIDGGTASGRTSIQITNLGGLGAATTGNGIQLIGAINGGTTTASTTRDAFSLAGGQVDAGAFEYRLYAGDVAGAGEGWFLRTQTGIGASPDPVLPEAYRVEVPLLAALPGLLQQGDLDFLGTYHRRQGDRAEVGRIGSGFTVPGRIWGRLLLDDFRYRQSGTVSPSVDGRMHGYQLGVDLFGLARGVSRHDFGIYGGHSEGTADVRGFSSGEDNLAVGQLKPDTSYAGLYWTYSNPRLYVDTVVQRSWYNGRARAVNGIRIDTDGTGILASVETGYTLPLSSRWSMQPQAQVVAQGVSLDRTAIPAAAVTQNSDGRVTARLGARLRGDYDIGDGSIQPYGRVDIWKGFASLDRTTFTTSSAATTIDTNNASFWGEAGGGLTWSPVARFAIYGEATHRFTLSESRGKTGHSTGGALGAKLAF